MGSNNGGGNRVPPHKVEARKKALIDELERGATMRKALQDLGLSSAWISTLRMRDPDFDTTLAAIQAKNNFRQYKEREEEKTLGPSKKVVPIIGNKICTATPVRDQIPKRSETQEEALDTIIEALLDGMDLQEAAMAASMSYQSVVHWMRKDPDVMNEINRAIALNIKWWIDKLKRCALAGNVRAIEVYLSRRYPSKWGETKAVDVSVRREEAIADVRIKAVEDDDVSKLTDAELAAEIAKLECEIISPPVEG